MKKPLLAACLLLSLTPHCAWAQHAHSMGSSSNSSSGIGTGIAAVVNENIITTIDVEQRLRLAILSSGLPDNGDVRAHLLPQILRGMIDEQLEAQEAKRLDITVTQDEINAALQKIAADNHIQGDMRQFVAAHGASADALVAQLRDSILWGKVVQRELRPRVDVGDDEIDAVIARIKADAGKEEYLVSEILLPVDNPKDEDQVHQLADNLVRQIKGGASFGAVARQFSQGSGASQGGDMGWIQTGQLAPEINKALANAQPGEVSAPIRTSNGYHILGVREKRTVALNGNDNASVNIAQAFRPYGNNKTGVLGEAARIHAELKSCGDLDQLAATFPGWKSQKLGDVKTAGGPPWLAKINGVAAGGSSEPLAADKGVVVIFVCSRNDSGDIDRDAIYHSIGTEKLELQARRLLRDLRRAAYLDIRIGQAS